MLAGALTAILIVAAPGAGTPLRLDPVYALQESPSGPEVDLLRLRAETLQEIGRARLPPGASAFAYSPDRRRLVFSRRATLYFVDLATMRVESEPTLRAGGDLAFVSRLIWPEPTIVLALGWVTHGPAWWLRVDPSTPSVVAEQEFAERGAGGTARLGSSFVAIRTPGAWQQNRALVGAPLRLHVFSPSGDTRSVRLARIRDGFEHWSVRRGGHVLPPLARMAVERVRADLARREGIPKGESSLFQ